MHFIAQWKEKALQRGSTYTTLDAMKLFAVVNMTADHLGHYYFFDELWWRAIGRITFPVWFFLVGYSRSRETGYMLWIYAILLVVDRNFTGFSLFPLNALASVIICRKLLNWLEDHQWLPGRMPLIVAVCMPLAYVTYPFFEYGTMAIMYAIYGRMVVKKENRNFLLLAIASYSTFLYWQLQWFTFDRLQGLYVALGSLAVVHWLATFQNKVLWTTWKDSWFKSFVVILSRNTMPYYFWHRLIMEIVAALFVGTGLGFAINL